MLPFISKARLAPFTVLNSVLFSTILLISAQAGLAAERPEWIEGKNPLKWDRARFLTAVGSGKTLEDASASAKKALAEVFHTSVQAKFSRNNQSELNESTTGKTEGSDSSHSTSNLEIKVDAQLRGAEIVQSYLDRDEKTYYAFAAMDRLKVKNIYLKEATKLKASIHAKLNQFKQTSRPADGEEIIALDEKFNLINTEYAVISDGASLPEPLSAEQLEAIKKKIREVSSAHALFLTVDGEMFGVKDLVARCLTAKGITVLEKARPENKLALVATLTQEQQEMAVEGWVKYEFLLTGSLQNGAESLGAFSAMQVGNGRNKKASFAKIKADLIADACGQILKLVNGN